MRLSYDNEGFAEQLMCDVSISAETLNDCFMEQAGLYAFYAMQAKKVSTALGLKRVHLDTHSAKLGKEFRKEYIASGIKATEKMIENQIFVTASYVKLNLDIVELKTTETLLRDCLESLKQKKDMMIQLAVQQREEFKGSYSSRVLENPSKSKFTARKPELLEID